MSFFASLYSVLSCTSLLAQADLTNGNFRKSALDVSLRFSGMEAALFTGVDKGVRKEPNFCRYRRSRRQVMRCTVYIDSVHHLKCSTLAVLFAFCQVMGVMCALPDLSLAESMTMSMISEGGMVCPMDGTIMCPSSIVSSPERQEKNSTVVDVDHVSISVSPLTALTNPSISTLCTWSSAFSIVPISIDSSSVLRI